MDQFKDMALLVLAFMLTTTNASGAVLVANYIKLENQKREEENRRKQVEDHLTELSESHLGKVSRDRQEALIEAQLQTLLAAWERLLGQQTWHIQIRRFAPVPEAIGLDLNSDACSPNDPEFKSLDERTRVLFGSDPTEVVNGFLRDVVARCDLETQLGQSIEQTLASIDGPQDVHAVALFQKGELFPKNLDQLRSRISDDLATDRGLLITIQSNLVARVCGARFNRLARSSSKAPPRSDDAAKNPLVETLDDLSNEFFILPQVRADVRGIGSP